MHFPLFIAHSKNKNKNFGGIGAETIAKDILWIMGLAGIDVETFKAHLVRHASLSAKRDHGVERDVFLASAKMSGPVFDKYYNVPIIKSQPEVRRQHLDRSLGSGSAALRPPEVD